MGKLSVVINTLNEEKNLPRAMASVKEWATEIVVVDMQSTDATVEIAKKMGAKVYTHEKTHYVEPARNFAISRATGDWILVLDADEEVPSELANKIKEVVNQSSADFYRIARKNLIFGKWIKHSGWWPDYNIRLFKKGAVTWNKAIHSIPETKGEGGEFEALENLAITHYHYTSLDQYLNRLVRYSGIQAKEKHEAGNRFTWLDLISKPANEFFRRYFREEGYKDGLHGLALSMLQAFSELVVYLRIWELEKFQEKELKVQEVISEMKKVQKDLNYWQADTLLKITKNPLQFFRRKLKV